MRIRLCWKTDEEAKVSCRRFGKTVAMGQLYAVGEDAAEVVWQTLPGQTRTVDRLLCGVKKKAAACGLPVCSFPAEEPSAADDALKAAGAVRYDCTEYLLKWEPSVQQQAVFAPEAVLLRQQEEGETKRIQGIRDGASVFSARLAPYRDGSYLYEVEVPDGLRNQGIGTAALRQILLRQRTPVYLQVGSYNERALHLYRKLGFRTETGLNYYR